MERQNICTKIAIALHFASLIGFYIGLSNYYRYITPSGLTWEYANTTYLLFLTTSILMFLSIVFWLGSLIVLLVFFVSSWKGMRGKKREDSSSSASQEPKK